MVILIAAPFTIIMYYLKDNEIICLYDFLKSSNQQQKDMFLCLAISGWDFFSGESFSGSERALVETCSSPVL